MHLLKLAAVIPQREQREDPLPDEARKIDLPLDTFGIPKSISDRQVEP
jgi:hypothetical protein